jgi:hypothetical protein
MLPQLIPPSQSCQLKVATYAAHPTLRRIELNGRIVSKEVGVREMHIGGGNSKNGIAILCLLEYLFLPHESSTTQHNDCSGPYSSLLSLPTTLLPHGSLRSGPSYIVSSSFTSYLGCSCSLRWLGSIVRQVSAKRR